VLKISPPPGFDPRTVQLVASRYTDYAIPAHRRQDDDIKMDFKEIGWEVVGWIDLALDRDKWRAVVNMVMNLRIS
jgi:hypothetical protein